MRFSAHEAETLKKIIADETGPLLERIEKLEKAARPLCSKCGLEDGACICAHLSITRPLRTLEEK